MATNDVKNLKEKQMNLSKQLYAIILFIFTMIFIGNFIISINNFKSYLEIESKTKSQDTATLLGMNLKVLISDKTDPEILSTISAIANRGFYKEIRLEDVEFNFTKFTLLDQHNLYKEYNIKDVSVAKNDGVINNSNDDLNFENELEELEGNDNVSDTQAQEIIYSFIPSSNFINKTKLDITFIAFKKDKEVTLHSIININKVLVTVSKNEKFDTVEQ